jgi:adenosine deaminase
MPVNTLKPAADLHNHLGASVPPPVLWSIAHRQGIRLPTKNYWEFEDMITMTGDERNRNIQEMHDRFFRWTELIQSSPEAIEESVKAVISGGYLKSNIVLHELRFNPMKRNRGGERDLDHIIMSALWGMDKALLEYPQVRAGLILMMDRTFPYGLNEIIVRKAIRYANRGVVGIDLAGPYNEAFSMLTHKPLFCEARGAGLGITVHTGEEGSCDEMRYVVDEIRPDRIGHGVKCVQDERLMARVAEQGTVLEICPTSNLRNSIIRDAVEMAEVFAGLKRHGIRFTVCTDGPEMYQVKLHQEQEFLVRNGILTGAEVEAAARLAFDVSFVGSAAGMTEYRTAARSASSSNVAYRQE